MPDPQWYSVLPPLLAIALAIWSKQVIPSLFAGIWMGHTLLSQFNPLAGLAALLQERRVDPADRAACRAAAGRALCASALARAGASARVRNGLADLQAPGRSTARIFTSSRCACRCLPGT